MQRALLAVAAAMLLATGISAADPVRDWHDLDKVHNKIVSAIRDMAEARAANHYDMAGHGAKAEELLRQADRELQLAVDAARASR
jgi:hypothetical protein